MTPWQIIVANSLLPSGTAYEHVQAQKSSAPVQVINSVTSVASALVKTVNITTVPVKTTVISTAPTRTVTATTIPAKTQSVSTEPIRSVAIKPISVVN